MKHYVVFDRCYDALDVADITSMRIYHNMRACYEAENLKSVYSYAGFTRIMRNVGYWTDGNIEVWKKQSE